MALVSQPGRHTQWKKVLTHTQSRRYFSKLIRNSAQLLLLNHNTRFSTIFNYAFHEEFLNLGNTHLSSFSDKLWCMNKSSSQKLGNKFLSGSCDILYCLLPSMSESNLGACWKLFFSCISHSFLKLLLSYLGVIVLIPLTISLYCSATMIQWTLFQCTFWIGSLTGLEFPALYLVRFWKAFNWNEIQCCQL